MNTSFISFERFSYDSSEWHVQINASNGSFSGVQDFYTYPEDLEALGLGFCKFPQNIQDEVRFELGNRTGNWAYFILVRAFLYDSVGHAAIEFSISNNAIPPYLAQTNFFICTEVASINNLAKKLMEWILFPQNKLLWIPCVS